MHRNQLRMGWLAPAILTIATGCATSSNQYFDKLSDMSAKDKSHKDAVAYIQSNKDDFYGKSQQIMYYTDLGVAYLKAGNLKEAAKNLSLADNLVDEQYKKNLSGMIAAFTISEETTDFVGDVYEHVQLSMYLSLVNAEMGNWEKAAVHSRKANERIAENIRIVSKAHGFDTDPNAAPSKKKESIKWHYVADPLAYYIGSVSYQNIGDKENGLVAARNSIKTYGTPAYKEAYGISTIPTPIVANYCNIAKTIDGKQVRSVDESLVRQNCNGVAAVDATKGELVVVKLNGRAATKQSLTVDIPTGGPNNVNTIIGASIGALWTAFSDDKNKDKSSIFYNITMGVMATNSYINDQIKIQIRDLERLGDKGIDSKLNAGLASLDTNSIRLSLPVTMYYRGRYDIPNVAVNGKNLHGALAQNYVMVKYKYVNDTMPLAMTRSASRALFRLMLQKGAETKGGMVAGMAVSAVTKSAESADTRSIRTFPAYVTIAQSPAMDPGTAKVEYISEGSKDQRSVKVEKGRTSLCVVF